MMLAERGAMAAPVKPTLFYFHCELLDSRS